MFKKVMFNINMDKYIKELVGELKISNSIQYIRIDRISYMYIDNIIALAESLRVNTSLHELYMDDQAIEDDSAKAIA